MANKGGPKKAAYDKAYNSTPEQLAKNAERKRARYAYEKAHGNLPPTVDVDHKTPLRKGGTNDLSNLRAVPEKKNVGWRKGKKSYD